ncbi:P-loop containing nucleoside triphosphate hydrolase protein [Thelonectria olida]|uniref:P-loop containing nucleoside triphosphate hydrolase protein n=1 Tax=Thelonectria olida TaxID=1576542 RepID=A0A9P8VU48_9HYPO|nr:P-loop containing nucleoside triphosphate hydrolase protein [Thelonectria olida]
MVEDTIAQLCTSDVVILVMGLTGVGKSSFIESLTDEDAGIGHGLVSATTCLGLHCYMIGSRRVFFVDTPGFDDTNRSDTQIFQDIAFFLSQTYKLGLRLGGIIYLHRITDNRVSGSAMRSFNLVKKMCGPEAAKFATLVTTTWDAVQLESPKHDETAAREHELRTIDEYWGSMVNHGSPMQRWTGTRASALSILTTLLWLSDNRGPVVLRLQKELVDEHKDLDDTSAGLELAKHHGATWQQLQQELKALRVSFEQALEARDRASSQHLQTQRTELERQMAIAETAERDLREDLESLFALKTEEYQRVFFETQEEVAELSRQVQELKTELKAIKTREDQAGVVIKTEAWPSEGARAATKRTVDHERHDKLQGEGRNRHRPSHKSNDARKQEIEETLAKAEKRKLLKRNLLSILGMLGGLVTIAAGAATIQIPVVAAGIALFGTAAMKLDFSKKKKKKKEDGAWEVDDHDG